ncbi:MAG: OmpH family outer membrane protein, partial [Sphingomonadales bacterium]|nr:OmpH family outer membrane protein [Sphingomonadales bacterium]
MIKLTKAAMLATVAIAGASVLTTPAFAQSRGATASTAVGIANLDQAVQQSAANATAIQQIQVTYAAQIAQHQARATALQAELQQLGAVVQGEQARNPQNSTALQAAVQAFTTRRTSAQQELGQILAPVELAVAYVREQITMRLTEALTATATARRLDVILTQEAAVHVSPSADVTAAVVTELNRLVPSVQIVPPQGYQPGALMRAAQAAAAA